MNVNRVGFRFASTLDNMYEFDLPVITRLSPLEFKDEARGLPEDSHMPSADGVRHCHRIGISRRELLRSAVVVCSANQ